MSTIQTATSTAVQDQSTGLKSNVVTRLDGKNALCTDTVITSLPSSSVQAWSTKLRYLNMDASNGGIAWGSAVGTTATTIFKYTGSGYIAGFLINTELFTDWIYSFLIDGIEIFPTGGLLSNNITGDSLYDLDDVSPPNQDMIGISKGSHDRLVYTTPLAIPIRFDSVVEIKLHRGVAGTKKFQSGLIIMSKET